MSSLLTFTSIVCGQLLATVLGHRDIYIYGMGRSSGFHCSDALIAGDEFWIFYGVVDIVNRMDWPFKYYVGFGSVRRDGMEFLECELNMEFRTCDEHTYGYYGNTCYCSSLDGTAYSLVLNTTIVDDYMGANVFIWWGDFEEGERSVYWNFHREVVEIFKIRRRKR